jgi:tetratricopeptide (TPR) repeat protein
VACALLTAACLTLGGLTIARNRVWSDDLNLWEDTTRKAPGRYLAWANLAGAYLVRNMPDQSIRAFVRAIEINPGLHMNIQTGLGEALQQLQRYDGRFTSGREYLDPGLASGAIGQDPRRMTRLGSVLFNNLGLAYEYLGSPVRARDAYRSALWANPDYDLAWYNLGLLAKSTGDGGQAAIALRELQRLNSSMALSLEHFVKNYGNAGGWVKLYITPRPYLLENRKLYVLAGLFLEVLDQRINILDHPVHALVEFLVVDQFPGRTLAGSDLFRDLLE